MNAAMVYGAHRKVVRNLKRRKVGDRQYEIIDKKTGEVVASAACTGEPGRDDYPWDVVLTEDGAPSIGAQPTLTQCIDMVATHILGKDLR